MAVDSGDVRSTEAPLANGIVDAFQKENPDITVRMEVLPYDQYWTKLTTELAGGKAPDVFWLTVDSFPDLAGPEQIERFAPILRAFG